MASDIELTEVLRTFPSDSDDLPPPSAPPTGALARLWEVGGLQAQVAVAWLTGRVRLLLADAGDEERVRAENELRMATAVVQRMGYLRGALAKVGQTVASTPLLPRAVLEVFDALHFQVPAMPEERVREVLFDELQGEPEELFAEFDATPFAAATLGQVHRARLVTGEAVAVKVQYPGIARAIHHDLRTLDLLGLAFGTREERENRRACRRELRVMLEAETDYLQEAAHLERARVALADLPEVVVARPIPERTTRRVLTTELLPGHHLPALLATGPAQAERDRLGTLVYEVLCHLILRAGMIHADPHVGNFLFLPDGRLGLIDLGAMRVIDAEERDFLCELFRAVLDPDMDYLAPMKMFAGLPEDEPLDSDHEDYLREFGRLSWECFRTDEPRAFGDDVFAALMELGRTKGQVRYLRIHPVLSAMARWGGCLGGLVNRLGARVGFRGALQRAMA